MYSRGRSRDADMFVCSVGHVYHVCANRLSVQSMQGRGAVWQEFLYSGARCELAAELRGCDVVNVFAR